jgi:GntP family gluconate:H+ symporter
MTPLLLLLGALLIVLGGILRLRLPAFLALVLGAYFVALLTPREALRAHAEAQLAKGEIGAKAAAALPGKSAGSRVAGEFGRACGNLGILLAMAAILGQAMLASGAAESVAAALLRLAGAARAHWAFFWASFTLCIPVFFDTMFYLLSPLYKAVGRRTGRHYLRLVLCTVAGGTITHSLVPPTPGPLFAAQALGVSLGTMIGMGLLVGLGAALSGVAYAAWADRRWTVTPPDEAEPVPAPPTDAPRTLPGVVEALLPVLLPLALILGASFGLPHLDKEGLAARVLANLGDKDMALTLGALAALATLARRAEPGAAARAVGTALGSGATILLITAAGAAFGGALQQTGIAAVLGQGLRGPEWLALPAVFLLTALVRTAQGSATVAMITAAPIAQALVEAGGGSLHPVYYALAIGCGSKPYPWMNDSGFWVISRLSGLPESLALRTVSVMMSVQGVAGLGITLALAALFPRLGGS